MKKLPHLFENNRQWADNIERDNPGFFQRTSKGQSPEYLWIGCSDSRIPSNEVVGLKPGELFVHRNVANLVIHTDMSLLSVLQYAVQVLKIKHVIVCGHYGCGGVLGAIQENSLGLIDNWLRYIKDVYYKNKDLLKGLPEEQKADRLCELNVVQQVANVANTTIVQEAWSKNQPLSIHGWVFALENGILKDLELCISSPEQLAEVYRMNINID